VELIFFILGKVQLNFIDEWKKEEKANMLCLFWKSNCALSFKGPFGAHDMIEIGYDMKLDKDKKWYKHDNIYPITCLMHTW